MYNDYLTLKVYDLKVKENIRRAENKVIPFDAYSPEKAPPVASVSYKPARLKRLPFLHFRPTSA